MQSPIAYFAARLLYIAKTRSPDFIIGGYDRPYLLRWWLIPRNPIFNVYLHEFRRDDDDRALHDHPWFNMSILLDGRYVEHMIKPGGIHRRQELTAGACRFRSPWTAHRIELIDDQRCWSLFVTGPRLRTWGFHCESGWVDWREFTNPDNHGEIGKGCP